MNQKTGAIKTPTNWQIFDLQQSWRWAQKGRLDSSIRMCYIGYLYVKKWSWIPYHHTYFQSIPSRKRLQCERQHYTIFEENRGECIYNFRVGKYFLNKKKYKSQRKILINSILKLRTFVHQKFHTIKWRASQKLSKDWCPEYTTPTNKEKSRKQCLENGKKT